MYHGRAYKTLSRIFLPTILLFTYGRRNGAGVGEVPRTEPTSHEISKLEIPGV
jgi:hypothetical protein